MKNKQDDNVVYVNGPEEAKQNNDERIKRSRRNKRIGFALALLLVVILMVVVHSLMNKEYKGYRVVKSSETNYENTANYIQFGGNLLKYTPDGVSYINGNGDTEWAAGIDMKMPVAVVSGNYAVVADLSGNNVCVFNLEGQVSSLTMPYTICDVDVANQGAFAVVLESEKTNYINLYDKQGEIVYEMQTTIDKSGYPLDISISDDGEKLFTSYLNVGGTMIQNNLTAYNFGDVGQNSNADRMVGGYMFDNQVIPKVEFVNNDTVVAFGTKRVNIYSMKEKPSEKGEIEFDTEIRSVFYNSDYIGVVQEAENSTEHPYVMSVYDLRGNLKFEAYVDFEYSNIYAAQKEIIVTGGTECKIFRTNGNVKFSGTLSREIESMVPSGGRLEYVVVYNNATEIIKLKSEEGVENTAEETTKEADGE